MFLSLLLPFWLLLICCKDSLQSPAQSVMPRAEDLIPSTPKQLQAHYGEALEAIFGIGIRLHALLDDTTISTNTNFLVSPLSIALIIGQLMLGSDGEFTTELYNLLSIPDASQKHTSVSYYGKRKNVTYTLPYARLHVQMAALVKALDATEMQNAFTLTTTNALFVNTSLVLEDEFLHHLRMYSTAVEALNFTTDPVGSQKIINDWAAAQTNGVIRNVLPSPLPVSASAVFTNAIYFKAEWETPFSYEANVFADFRSSKDRRIEVEYMRGFFENISYIESDKLNCKMIALPYKNNELAMYLLMPNENNGSEYDIRKFSGGLKAKEVLEAMEQMKSHSVTVQIPKMKLSNSLSVLEPLQRYHLFQKNFASTVNGSKDPFDVLEDRVDQFSTFNKTEDVDILLTRAAVGKNLRISSLLQQMTLSVDEKGTEAAAVTLSIIDYIGGTKLFVIDRPFVFFIRHELTSAILFWGTIVNPQQVM